MKLFAAMKIWIALVTVLAHAASMPLKDFDGSFGPRNCIMLTRSTNSTCVITTDCASADTSKTEFAFDCVGQEGGDVVRHSFGIGGFDPNEEFDTGIKCGRCDAVPQTFAEKIKFEPVVAEKPNSAKFLKVESPSSKKQTVTASPVESAPAPKVKRVKIEAVPKRLDQSAIVKATGRSGTHAMANSQTKASFWPFTSTKKEPEVVKYGPDGCVSVYKNDDSNCIMQTECAKADISSYQFGLVCVDKVGTPVRHLFGKGSFDKEETFDTLIKCEQCLGLEDVPDAIAVNGEIVAMSADVSQLKAIMANITVNVQMLNQEVFKAAPSPAPAPIIARKHSFLRHRSSPSVEDSDEDDDDGRYDGDDDSEGYP